MKKLYVLMLLISLTGYTQTYTFGVCYTNSMFIKMEGTIVINDKKVILEVNDNNNKTVVEYDMLKGTDEVIFITDGVWMHSLNFLNEKGKKKGFEHDTVIVLTFDKRKDDAQIKYYCNLLK